MRQLLYQIVYHPLVNFFLLRINKMVSGITHFKLPPSCEISVNIKPNIHFKMATNQTCYVTFLLYWKGPESFEYTSVFKNLIWNCKVFIDIGANTGYYSLLAGKANDRLRTYAFEPAKGPLYYLKRNIELNKLGDRIEAHHQALSDRNERAHFYEVKNRKYTYLKYNLGGVGSLQVDSAKSHDVVETKTLDSFVSENSIEVVDLIKIDTEGTEIKILEGASNTLNSFKPIVICETLFDKIEAKLERTMKSHGYLFYQAKNGKLVQVDTIIREKDDGVRDCFFVHPSKLDWIRFIVSN